MKYKEPQELDIYIHIWINCTSMARYILIGDLKTRRTVQDIYILSGGMNWIYNRSLFAFGRCFIWVYIYKKA